MKRGGLGCAATALLMFVSLGSETAEAAEPGFYFGASGSRVKHDVEGWPGMPVITASLSPTPFPPGFGGIIIPFPPGTRPPVFGTPDPGVPISPVFIAPDSVEIDDVDVGYSITAGYRFNRYLAAEVSYEDFGEYERLERYSFGTVRYQIGVRGPSVALLGTLPLTERFELYARGGVLFADQEVSFRVTSNSPSTNGPDRDYSDEVIIAGAGLEWAFAPRWAARLEYQLTDDLQYDNTGESSIDQATLSVLFKL
jgi:opacity protein-like surface antigen